MTDNKPPADGFKLLLRRGDEYATSFDRIAKIVKRTPAGYKVVKRDDGIWIRRRRNPPHALGPPHEVALPGTAAESFPTTEQLDRSLRTFRSSGFNDVDVNPNQLPLDDAVSFLPADSDEFTPSNWDRACNALFFVAAQHLPALLSEHFAPLCRQWLGHCEISVRSHNYAYEQRLAMLRNIRLARIHDADLFRPDTPQSLMDWQHLAAQHLAERLAIATSLSCFPHCIGLITSRPGLTIQITGDCLPPYESDPFPRSLLELAFAYSSFAETPHTITETFITDPPTQAVFHRYAWDGPADNGDCLLNWMWSRSAAVLENLFDVTLYPDSTADPNRIDHLLPWEVLQTLDRVCRRVIQLQSSESRVNNKLLVFEVADHLAEVFEALQQSKAGERFSTLFSRDFGAELSATLGQLPAPWGDRFAEVCVAVYTELHETVKQSVWARRMQNEQGVVLRVADGSASREPWDSFVTATLRDLRNTHHGYSLKRKGARTRLMLTTGALPESMTLLPTLWLLAALADPEMMLGFAVPDDPPS